MLMAGPGACAGGDAGCELAGRRAGALGPAGVSRPLAGGFGIAIGVTPAAGLGCCLGRASGGSGLGLSSPPSDWIREINRSSLLLTSP